MFPRAYDKNIVWRTTKLLARFVSDNVPKPYELKVVEEEARKALGLSPTDTHDTEQYQLLRGLLLGPVYTVATMDAEFLQDPSTTDTGQHGMSQYVDSEITAESKDVNGYYSWAKRLENVSEKGDREIRGRDYFFGERDSQYQLAMSQISLARNELKEARRRVLQAIEYARPHMRFHVERCQQLLFTIQIEEASRQDITEKATRDAEAKLKCETNKLIQKFTKEIEEKQASEQNDLKKLSEELDEDNRKETRKLIDATVLRVIEILGIFVAISLVLFTSLEGLRFVENLTDAILIYGLGMFSVTLLIGLIFLLKKSWEKKEPSDNGKGSEAVE